MENYYSVNKFQIIIKREKGCRFKIPYMNEKILFPEAMIF